MLRPLGILSVILISCAGCNSAGVQASPSSPPASATPTSNTASQSPFVTQQPLTSPASPSAQGGSVHFVATSITSEQSTEMAGYHYFSVYLALVNDLASPVTLGQPRSTTLSVAEGRSYPGLVPSIAIGGQTPIFLPPGVTLCGTYDGYGQGWDAATSRLHPFKAGFGQVPATVHPASLLVDGFPSTDLGVLTGKCTVKLPGLEKMPLSMSIPLPQADSGSRMEIQSSESQTVSTAVDPAVHVTIVHVNLVNGSALDPVQLKTPPVWGITSDGYISLPFAYQSAQGPCRANPIYTVGPGQQNALNLCFDQAGGQLTAIVVTFGPDAYKVISLGA